MARLEKAQNFHFQFGVDAVSFGHMSYQIPAASPDSQPAYALEGMQLTDHRFSLPLNYAEPDGEKVTVFVREVVALDRADDDSLPWLVYFQGGPGFPSPRPVTKSGWLGEVLKTHRVALLDQRGTGLSSRVLAQNLQKRGSAQEQAEFLTHFRADNIVRDAEAIRKGLCGDDKKWVGMGQSYGGFCLLTYLSFAPHGLSGVVITGGVACVKRHIDDNYRLTYQKVLEKNAEYYQRYPQDRELAKEILAELLEKDIRLPSGGRLTGRRFQQLGMLYGMSGGFETMHYLLESAFIGEGADRELSFDFLNQIERLSAFETNPFFAVLHETIYGEGYATNWSAERLRAEFPSFELDPANEVRFTGEMIVPSMFDDYVQLQPMKECAEILARKEDWGPLYDLDQLASNEVPVSAISYYSDMYVPIEWSRETALHMPRFYQWVTNEWEHNGIGVDGPRIARVLLDKLKEV